MAESRCPSPINAVTRKLLASGVTVAAWVGMREMFDDEEFFLPLLAGERAAPIKTMKKLVEAHGLPRGTSAFQKGAPKSSQGSSFPTRMAGCWTRPTIGIGVSGRLRRSWE